MVITVIIIITLSVNSATEVQYLELFHFAYDFLPSVPSPQFLLCLFFSSPALLKLGDLLSGVFSPTLMCPWEEAPLLLHQNLQHLKSAFSSPISASSPRSTLQVCY